VRQLPIGSILSRLRFSAACAHSENSVRPRKRRWFPALLVAASALTAAVCAQEHGAEPAQMTTAIAPSELAPRQLGPGLPAAGQGSFPGAVSGTEGATAGAVAPGPLSPSRLGRPAPGNRGPG